MWMSTPAQVREMAYATANDYALQLHCETRDSAELAALLEQASDDVDALCYGRIRKAGFEKLTAFQQEKIKKAVCLHAAFLSAYGEALSSPLSSYGINGVSMSFDATRTVTQGSITTSNAVMAQLRQSGLATRLIP